MSPATHAALGAAIASAAPRLWAAIPLAFFSHFLCDAVYHFEEFGPLAQHLRITQFEAFSLALGIVALPLLPLVWWICRGDKELLRFCLYMGVACLPRLLDHPGRSMATALLLAAVFLWTVSSAQFGSWIVCGLAATVPDWLRKAFYPLQKLHFSTHYGADLGEVVQERFVPGPRLAAADRFEDPYYLLGYALEVVFEAAVLLGSLYFVSRRRRRHPALARFSHQVARRSA